MKNMHKKFKVSIRVSAILDAIDKENAMDQIWSELHSILPRHSLDQINMTVLPDTATAQEV